MKQLTIAALAFCVILSAELALAKNIRATEMTDSQWSQLYSGKLIDCVIEFREGDNLPVTFAAEGDLFTSTQSSVAHVGVKRNFWVRVNEKNVEMSLDGINYKPINDVVGGNFSVGTNENQDGGVADSIQMNLKLFLKPANSKAGVY
ncbi:MAG: hypothetical protein ACXVCY_00010 [Pseudobdellovibrionaceae bacterium]